MGARYAVLLKDIEHFDMIAAARAYRDVVGVPMADASSRMRKCGGVIDESLSKELASRLVGKLSSARIAAIKVPAENLVEFPPAELCHRGSRTEDGFILEKAELSAGRRAVKRFRIIGRNIVLFTAGIVKEKKRYKRTEYKREVTYISTYGAMMSNVPEVVTGHRDVFKYYLDICAIEPTSHCRIEAGQFNFLRFGLGVARTQFQNLVKLVGWIKSIATEAYIDKSIRWVLDGDPKTNLRMPCLEAYDNYVFRVTQMAYLPPE